MARPRRLNWTQLIEDGHSAIVGLDASRRIRAVSPGITQLTGWTIEDLLSLRCDQATLPDQPMPGDNPLADLVAVALAPPQAGQSGRIVVRETVLPNRAGHSVRLQATFVPLLDTWLDGPQLNSNAGAVGGAGAGAGAHRQASRSEAGEIAAILIILCPADPGTEPDGRMAGLHHLHAEINALRLDLRRRFGTDSYIGQSPRMRRALRQAELVRQSSVSFCITGEVGTGRRHLMRIIHHGTAVSDQSLVFLDCHLLSPAALLATLHRLRSTHRRESLLPHQRMGLLVLSEIQSLPIEVQRWIVDQKYLESDLSDPAGDQASDTGPVRIAAVSQIPLMLLQHQDRLLPELANQLSNVEIQLPALRDRSTDILLLFRQFIDECRRDHRTSAESFSSEVRAQLLEYAWPGQVKELRTVAEAACRACASAQIEVHDLPWQFRVAQDAQRKSPPPQLPAVPLEQLLREFETEVIEQTLETCAANKTEAARRLGLTRQRLYRRMKTLGLESGDDGRSEVADEE